MSILPSTEAHDIARETEPDQLAALMSLSARLGANPLRTQGAGGNTSIKDGDSMWIKASGTWLAQAQDRPIMIRVALPPLLAAYHRREPEAETAKAFILSQPDGLPSGVTLRPSIETAVHAVIPCRVVVHIHCVETIAHAVRKDARERLKALLDPLAGVAWAFVDYHRPGVPLARAIETAQSAVPDANVHILANHGLIVSGDTVAEVETRLDMVCAALAITPRPAPQADLARLAELAAASGYRLPSDPHAHATGTDPRTQAVAQGAPMYPDQVIFLGDRIGVLQAGESLDAHAADAPMLVIVPGCGVLVRGAASDAGTDVMARCLADVARRLDISDPLRRLTADEIYALTHWEAETYRQSLHKAATHA